MSATHPVVFVRELKFRLGVLHNALEQLKDLLPRFRSNGKVRQQLHCIQLVVLRLLIDAREASPTLVSALEKHLPAEDR